MAKPLRWTNERGVVSIAVIVCCGVSGVTASEHHDFSYRAYHTAVLPLLVRYSRVTKYLCVCRTCTLVRSIQLVQKRRNALIRVAFCACVHYFARYAHTHKRTYAIVTRTCVQAHTIYQGYIYNNSKKIKEKFLMFTVLCIMRQSTTLLFQWPPRCCREKYLNIYSLHNYDIIFEHLTRQSNGLCVFWSIQLIHTRSSEVPTLL